jgi:hypothetical protein
MSGESAAIAAFSRGGLSGFRHPASRIGAEPVAITTTLSSGGAATAQEESPAGVASATKRFGAVTAIRDVFSIDSTIS